MTLGRPHIRTRRVVDANRFSGAGLGLNAHWRVAKVAVEMANVLWEEYARANSFYHAMRADGRVTEKAARQLFIERVAPRLLEDARRALTDMLTQPDDRVPVAIKDQIADALIKDSDLRGKRFVAEANATVPASIH